MLTLLRLRDHDGGLEYLVRWSPSGQPDTWEPAAEIAHEAPIETIEFAACHTLQWHDQPAPGDATDAVRDIITTHDPRVHDETVTALAVISTVLKGGGPNWTVLTCLATPTTTFAHAVATTTLHCASLPFDPTHDHVHFTLTAQTTAAQLLENVSALSTPDGFDLFIGTPDDSRNGFVSRQHHRHIPIHRVHGDSWHYTFVAAVDAATATRVSYSISVLRRALELGTDQQRHAVYTALATGARLPAMPDHIDGLAGFAPDLFTAIPPARSVDSTADNA